VCEFVVGDNPWTINLNNSTHICSQSDVSDYNSNTKWSVLFSVFNNCSNLQVDTQCRYICASTFDNL
jgi:hypothetical protein